jgi:glucokinase
MKQFMCLDVGGTKIRGALFGDENIEPIRQQKIPTQNQGQKVEDRICGLIREIWPVNSNVDAIAIAAPGFVDSDKGVVIRAVNIPGWEFLPLQKILQDKFNTPVIIGNDARLAALGEWKYGAAIGHHDVIYLTISTGIGGGVIIKDRVLMGSRGMATELGHITILPDGPLCSCGQKGHLEAISSGPAIAQFVQEEIKNGKKSSVSALKNFSSKEIAQAAFEGDELCQLAYKRAGSFLGMALVNLLHTFNPTCVVLGGGVSFTGDLLLEPMQKEIEKSILSKEYLGNLTFSTAKLGENAGLIGGLVLITVNNL